MSVYFEKARELGELLLSAPQGIRHEIAKNKFAQDAEAVALLNEFKSHQTGVQESVSRNALTQEEYNAAVKDLTEKTIELKKHPLIGELANSESEFYAFVNQVLDVVKSTITGEVSEGCGCGGSCGSECSSEGCGGGCSSEGCGCESRH